MIQFMKWNGLRKAVGIGCFSCITLSLENGNKQPAIFFCCHIWLISVYLFIMSTLMSNLILLIYKASLCSEYWMRKQTSGFKHSMMKISWFWKTQEEAKFPFSLLSSYRAYYKKVIRELNTINKTIKINGAIQYMLFCLYKYYFSNIEILVFINILN